MQPIRLPRLEGTVSRQAHADLPAGTYEREQGREGFAGPATHFHHRNPPTAWIDFQGPCRPRLFDWSRYSRDSASPWEAQPIAHNAHLKLRLWRTARSMDHLARNADGDDLLFLHEGTAEFFCDYGHLTLAEGDYVVIPRGTMWRIDVSAPVCALLLEATNESFRIPDRGVVGRHALFDLAVLDTPRIDAVFEAQKSQSQTSRVVFKKQGQLSVVTYPFNPLDTIGWHGDLAPLRLNWRNIRPLNSHRYHLPPSAHCTFEAPRFAVCTFVPRPVESDPGALKVPFFHNNDDYDEIGFLHTGQFFSRDNVKPGMMTFHPSGFAHGPHPVAFESAEQNAGKITQEVLINIDARDALEIGEIPDGVEVADYVSSWKPWLKRLR